MSCSIENREERLLNYISGSLETQEAALFERHLESCAVCREFVAGQKAVWQDLDLFEPAPVSDDFNRRLYARIAQTSWWDRLTASIATPFRGPAVLRQGLPIITAAAALATAFFVWDRPAHDPASVPQPAALSSRAESLQADQVQRALDDMDMLRQFNHLVNSDSATSKM